MLSKAVKKYRNDWQAISTTLKTKTPIQARMKVDYIFKCIKSNPKHEHAKYAKILKEISLEGKRRWTVSEQIKYNKALQKYGKDYSKIKKCLPNITHEQIRTRTAHLLLKIQEDKNHPDSNLKEVLEKSHSRYWTQKEETTFVKMLKKHGKNYKLIQAAIPTKTLEQVIDFRYRMFV